MIFKNMFSAGEWWFTPLIPALSRQGQADLFKLAASLGYLLEFQDNQG